MFESGEHISVRVSFRWQANSRRCALLAQRRKLRASNQHGPFGSLDAIQATKQNANAGFGPFDATQARQHLRPGSPKKGAGYQSRPYRCGRFTNGALTSRELEHVQKTLTRTQKNYSPAGPCSLKILGPGSHTGSPKTPTPKYFFVTNLIQIAIHICL
jgi:hypothetical protein